MDFQETGDELYTGLGRQHWRLLLLFKEAIRLLDKRMRWLTVEELEAIKHKDYLSWRVRAHSIMSILPLSQVYITKAPFLIGLTHRLNNEPIYN